MNFQFLSYVYEYSWYGEFNLDETTLKRAEIAGLKLITKIIPPKFKNIHGFFWC